MITCQDVQKMLHSHVLPTIVDLNFILIQIQQMIGVMKDCRTQLVASVARHVICQHEDDVIITDSEPVPWSVSDPLQEQLHRQLVHDSSCCSSEEALP